MQLSNIAEYPFKLGAELRHRRAFHPIGVLAGGTIERIAPVARGLPIGSGDVMARLSKGAGFPGGIPDFAGLAWRMNPGPFAANPWDVLMVSAGSSALGRILLRPTASWSSATFSTLMPLGYDGEVWWLRARLTDPDVTSGLTVDDLTDALRSGTVIRIAVDQSSGLGEFVPLATLTLTDLLPQADGEALALDPTTNSAPGVTLLPGWLTALRRGAYRGSREGRQRTEAVDSRYL